jgi:hypothetical protein
VTFVTAQRVTERSRDPIDNAEDKTYNISGSTGGTTMRTDYLKEDEDGKRTRD